jgi:hypothetical protein
MSNLRSGLVRFAILLWAVYTMFAQPGLPACWLEQQPCEYHVHFGGHQAQMPHTHFYLIDLSQGMAAQPAPLVQVSSTLLVLFLSLSGVKLWQRKHATTLNASGWMTRPESPPPKFDLSSI